MLNQNVSEVRHLEGVQAIFKKGATGGEEMGWEEGRRGRNEGRVSQVN